MSKYSGKMRHKNSVASFFALLSYMFFAVSLILLVSCTYKKEVSEAVQVALTSPPQTLDPRLATDANGQYITSLLFNALVRIGPDLKPINDASTRWSYKNLVYTFDLHKDLTFSNGVPVTGQDILFSFDQYRTKGPFQSALQFIKDVKVHKEAGGYLRVQLILSTFRDPLSFFSDISVVKILPQAIVSKYKKDFFKHLVGSGSFVLEEQSSEEIVLRAREQHPIATPKVKRVVFKIIRNSNTLYFKTIKEEFDIVQSEMPHYKIQEFTENKNFQVFKYPGLKMSYLLLNLRHPVLASLSSRKAIALALNRDEIIKFKLSGLAVPATSLLTPKSPFFHAQLQPLTYNVEGSQKIFSQMKLSQPLQFKTSHHPSSVEIGRVIGHQLRQAGLDIQTQSFEWATYYGDIQAGRFHIALMRWVGAISPNIYKIALHSLEIPPKGRNRGFYKNEELDQLLESGPQVESFEERKVLYQKVQEIVMKDLPIIPLWYNIDVCLVHKRIKNYRPSLNGDFTSLLSVEKSSQER